MNIEYTRVYLSFSSTLNSGGGAIYLYSIEINIEYTRVYLSLSSTLRSGGGTILYLYR